MADRGKLTDIGFVHRKVTLNFLYSIYWLNHTTPQNGLQAFHLWDNLILSCHEYTL